MKFLHSWMAAWVREKRGQDMIEYAMLAGFIAVVVAAFFPTQIAPSISTVFSKVSAQLASAGS